jgi:FG-GAP-like repeat
MPTYIAALHRQRMRRFFCIRKPAFVCVVLVAAGFQADIRVSGQSPAPDASGFEMGAATHETQAQSPDSFQLPNETGLAQESESVSPPPPTRSSFMATWPGVSGAQGYLLDVSTSSSFADYVDGYHDLDVGNAKGRVVTGLNRGTTYYYRVRAYGAAGANGYSEMVAVTTEPTTGLTIHPTFDGSITGNANAAAIQAMINRAIGFYESLFSDPITIQIRFRYATTAPDGSPLPQGLVSQSDTGLYIIPWNTYISALRADAETNNDNVANASLPGSALSANMRPASANGRAVGLNTPPAMFANGTVGQGGPYDGIVTLNSSKPFQFSRPINGNNFDAQRVTEHEIDEVIGLGSRIGQNSNNLRPQDLFSWSSAGHRNISSSGMRYFSINGGVTNIVNFNRDSAGDFGDWLSEDCPQSHPYVQNAFTCMGQSSDIAATSPEGVNLDVIGYDLGGAPPPTPTPTPTPRPTSTPIGPPIVATNPATNVANFSATLNGTVNPNGLSTAVHFEYGTTTNYTFSTATQNYNGSTAQNVMANLSSLTAGASYHFQITASNAAGTTYGSDRTFTTPVARAVVGDFNGDGTPDLVAQRTSPHQTAALYLNDNVVIGAAWGPTLPAGWGLAGAADFDGDGHTDYVLFNSGGGQTVVAYLSGLTVVDAAYGPSLPAGWELVAIADFNGDGHPDYVLYKPSTRQTTIYYLNNNVFTGSASGPTLPPGWNLIGVADFDGDGHSDYALFNSNTGQTVIGYLSGPTVIGAAFGPTLPYGWPLVAAADFDGDGNPDYLLYNGGARQTAIGYLNNNVLVDAALGPALPSEWSLVTP